MSSGQTPAMQKLPIRTLIGNRMLACFKYHIAWRARLFVGLCSCVAFPSFAQDAQIFDYRLGDHVIDYPLSTLDVISSGLDSFGGQAFIHVNAPNSTEVVLKFEHTRQTLQQIEHSWIDRSSTAPTALGLPGFPEFTFGQTSISDIRLSLGQQGFQYTCRQLEPISEKQLTFVSFEMPERKNVIYTFIAEDSQELADDKPVENENMDLTQTILIAVIVSQSRDLTAGCEERFLSKVHPVEVLEEERFETFLPGGAQVTDKSPWELTIDPHLMIHKNGALTWGDRLYIIPNPADCTRADFMIWAHTFDDEGLLALKGQEVDAAFNILLVEQNRVPLQSPVPLANTLYAPIHARDWPPFALGSFVFGSFDFVRIIATEPDPSVLGFSLEFPEETAGFQDNYWSLEGLFEVGNKALWLCREGEG